MEDSIQFIVHSPSCCISFSIVEPTCVSVTIMCILIKNIAGNHSNLSGVMLTRSNCYVLVDNCPNNKTTR